MSNVKIKSIIDTRQRDDNGQIIPYSGDTRNCAHCGRPHDIHATLSDGRIVGVSCAKRLGLPVFPARRPMIITVSIAPAGSRQPTTVEYRFADGSLALPVEQWRGTVDEVAAKLSEQFPSDKVAK